MVFHKGDRNLDHFHIVQALCRASLSTPSQAIVKQVERLRDALQKDGATAEAKKLSRLLTTLDKTCDMAPSRLTQSKAMFSGEMLTPKTPIPVDKETSTPLVEIIFPENLPTEAPIFNENVKMGVRSVLDEWENFERLRDIDAHPSKSCLIYGPPGSGKTHLALWMASQLGVPVVMARLDGLMSSFLGTTSRNIGNLFSFVSKYKCILLLDEFDAIAKLRNDPQEVGEVKRVVNALLQNLDTRQSHGFTIGITNHESLLDPAIWRRFDVQVEIPNPNSEVLIELINKFMKPLDLNEEQIKFLAWIIEGGSGADVKSLIQWLKKSNALNQGNGSDFIGMMSTFSLLNAGRINKEKRNYLAHSYDGLISALLDDTKYKFKQKDVAQLFGMTPSNLSKRLSKYKDEDSEVAYAQ